MVVAMVMLVLHRCSAVCRLVHRRRRILLDHRCGRHRCTLRGRHLGIRRLRVCSEGKQTSQGDNRDLFLHGEPRCWNHVGDYVPTLPERRTLFFG